MSFEQLGGHGIAASLQESVPNLFLDLLHLVKCACEQDVSLIKSLDKIIHNFRSASYPSHYLSNADMLAQMTKVRDDLNVSPTTSTRQVQAATKPIIKQDGTLDAALELWRAVSNALSAYPGGKDLLSASAAAVQPSQKFVVPNIQRIQTDHAAGSTQEMTLPSTNLSQHFGPPVISINENAPMSFNAMRSSSPLVDVSNKPWQTASTTPMLSNNSANVNFFSAKVSNNAFIDTPSAGLSIAPSPFNAFLDTPSAELNVAPSPFNAFPNTPSAELNVAPSPFNAFPNTPSAGLSIAPSPFNALLKTPSAGLSIAPSTFNALIDTPSAGPSISPSPFSNEDLAILELALQFPGNDFSNNIQALDSSITHTLPEGGWTTTSTFDIIKASAKEDDHSKKKSSLAITLISLRVIRCVDPPPHCWPFSKVLVCILHVKVSIPVTQLFTTLKTWRKDPLVLASLLIYLQVADMKTYKGRRVCYTMLTDVTPDVALAYTTDSLGQLVIQLEDPEKPFFVYRQEKVDMNPPRGRTTRASIP
ncbi:hypothetical protein CF319_g2025 [Tilletia indica]|uniref:Uncharacterized protein n=1 Tax=Tilletia indica TaxID=43049 RepID=A0A177T9Y5_9BASI|nr:hypothetical protein CF319_g2025 [Tilletia indica]KAE8246529.1 hypothetical protein A4X13_0g5746 [Tilletia indica]